jgi:hypothetical protein
MVKAMIFSAPRPLLACFPSSYCISLLFLSIIKQVLLFLHKMQLISAFAHSNYLGITVFARFPKQRVADALLLIAMPLKLFQTL